MPHPKTGSQISTHRQAWWPETLAVTEALGGQHLDLLIRAVLRVIRTKAAHDTYVQIADGAPLEDGINHVNYGSRLFGGKDNPLRDHKTLCPGAAERLETFRASFKVESLRFDKQVLIKYKAASPGSSAFKTRLVELVAVAIHQIAALLFGLNQGVHKQEDIRTWRADRGDKVFWENFPDGLPWPPFRHAWYTDSKQYPAGPGDVVGYWAERRILGGVVLFDRRQIPGAYRENIFLHPDGMDTTYRICLVTPDQRQLLLDFLINDSEGSCPLPILVDERNSVRVDPEEDIVNTGIYRDIWERAPRSLEMGDDRLSDVFTATDYPTVQERIQSTERALARRRRLLRDKAIREGRDVEQYVKSQMRR